MTEPTAAITHVVCIETGKRGYSSRQAAMKANRRNSLRLRFYFCTECKRWHVTKDWK